MRLTLRDDIFCDLAFAMTIKSKYITKFSFTCFKLFSSQGHDSAAMPCKCLGNSLQQIEINLTISKSVQSRCVLLERALCLHVTILFRFIIQ